MNRARLARLGIWTAALATAGAAFPAAASAHGLVGNVQLPIPQWLFAWVAAVVLIVSFVALGTLWSTPRLQGEAERRVGSVPAPVEIACGALGVAVFLAVVICGLDGTAVPTANIAPTTIYVLFWVGIPVFSALIGDVFRLFNPWLATARAVRWLLARRWRPAPLLDYPAWLGRWPAAAGLVGFAWLELVYVNRDLPSTLAVLALSYAGLQLAGMALFGIVRWSSRADAFGVVFGIYGSLAPLDWRDRALWVRRPLSGATGLVTTPGTIALICAMIGTTTFDGASNGPIWLETSPRLQDAIERLGLGFIPAMELVGTAGLLVAVLAIGAFYRIGITGMSSVGIGEQPAGSDLARRFAHTLVPIAWGYLLAHYFSLLVFQGQATGFLISDPMGKGANLFGTASFQINYNLISSAGIWYVQVAALVVGHVAGLTLAHDRALVVYPRSEDAVRSQYWMLAVMVGFTCLGLYLLSAIGT